MGGAEYQGSGGVTTFTGLTDTPTAYTGQSLRRPRVNDGATALEFDYDAVDIINVEEARSDIRSTTRAGYSTYNSQPGLQALIDAVGNYKVLRFPANGIFNLGGVDLVTKSNGQRFISNGAGLQNGGVQVLHSYCKVAGFYIYGTSPYGIYLAPGTGTTIGPQQAVRYDVFGGQNLGPDYFEDLHILGKTYGVYIPVHNDYVSFKNVRVDNCSTAGFYISMLTNTWDHGDLSLENCDITHSAVGIWAVKVGGLRVTNCKIQANMTAGILLEPTTAVNTLNSGTQGIYLDNNSLEDNGSVDLKITAQTGVNSNRYPNYIHVVGGDIHRVIIDKANEVTFVNSRIHFLFQINTGATQVIYLGSNACSVTGAGTDYMMLLNSSGVGPHIRVGTQLKLYDAANPTGKVL